MRDGCDLCAQTPQNHSKKKTKHYKEQDPKKVAEYEEKVKDIPKDKRVYVDESGFDRHYCREYARAPRGEKVHEVVPGRGFKRTSIVAGKMGDKIVAPFLYDGTMHGEMFDVWFEEQLLAETPEDTVIIMDNASFHRKKRLFEIAGRHNRRLIFLPPYSPELNPIEHFWSWLKRTVIETLAYSDTLFGAISLALLVWRDHIGIS